MNSLFDLLREVNDVAERLKDCHQKTQDLPLDEEWLSKMSTHYELLTQLNLLLQMRLQSALTMSKEVGKTLKKKKY